MDRIRLAAWGTGGMAKKHIANAVAHPHVELCAIIGRNQDSCLALQKEFGSTETQIYTNIDDCLNSNHYDALMCAIPPGIQTNQAQRAAENGIHLFLEKPIALNLETLKNLESAAQKNQIKTQVCHQFRFDESVQWLRQQIDSGQAGKVCQYQGRFWMNADLPPWWKNSQLGGGQVVEQLIHNFDLALYFCGQAERVSGFWSTLLKDQDPDYQVDDNSVCNIAFKNGSLAHISGSNTAIPDRWISDWRIICEHMTIELKDADGFSTPITNVYFSKDKGEIGKTFKCETDLHKACMDNWIDAITNNVQCLSPIEDAVKTHAVVFAAAESMRQNGQLNHLPG